jgi:hypothetical protein
MPDALSTLTDLIRNGLAEPTSGVRSALEALFGSGGRYHKRHYEPVMIRDAFALADADGNAGVPFAAFINSENPPSGPYGGASIA